MSEFPNDNPELWRARPVVFVELERERAPVVAVVAAESDEEPCDVEVAEFDDADFAVVENESLPPPAPHDVFQVYVRTLVEVALAAGAPGRIAELLPGMLGVERLDVRDLGDAAIDALVAADLLARSETGAVTRSASLTAGVQAWRATLLGEEGDFSTCTATLDEWSAYVVSAVAGAPAQRESMRRDLRARGVAAFGFLVDAA